MNNYSTITKSKTHVHSLTKGKHIHKNFDAPVKAMRLSTARLLPLEEN